MGNDVSIGPGLAAASDEQGSQAVKDQLWAFAQHTQHAILWMDRDGVVRWANPGAGKIFAAPVDDIVGCAANRFFVPEDRDLGVPEQEFALAASRGSAEDDRWMQRADGARFWASGMSVALRDAGGQSTGFIKILRDLTDLKMQIETLRNRATTLEAGEDERRRAMAVLSHELRNPLAAIGMASAMLRKGADPDDSRMHLPLGMLDRNLGFSARLLDDLDDIGRVSEGKFDLQISRVSLRELLTSAMATANQQHGADRRDGIELLLPPSEITVEADSLRMQQVFANLIGNAIKFTPGNERIWVSATVEGPQVVVRVEDDGIGIAPDRLEHIFEMFTQAHHPRTRRGLGIGLAVVKSLVELHGGSVQARSDGIGKGSSFTVRLPLRQPGRKDAEARSGGMQA